MAGQQTAIGLAYAQQMSTSETTYAGGGAWGSTGTASWTTSGLGYPNLVGNPQASYQTQRNDYDMRWRSGLRLTIPQQRIIMPQQVWSNWNAGNYYDDTSASTTTETVSSVEFQQRVWGSWVEHEAEQAQQAHYMLNQQGLEAVRQENARRQQQYQEAQELYQQQAEERAQKQAEEQKRKETAEDVAQILLGEIIGEEQLAVYKETGRLLVRGKKHDYLVWKTGKVQRIEKGKIIDLCVYTKEKIIMPPTDNVIGLAMHIKADEKEFNRIANGSAPRPRPITLDLAANY